ncbi:MAG: type II secretion system F family protein [Pseudomonadota bacterium]
MDVTENLILAAVFMAVVLVVFIIAGLVSRRREIRRNIDDVTAEHDNESELESLFSEDNDSVRHYFEVQRKNRPDSLEMRLISAGFMTRGAVRLFNLLRFALVVVVFAGVQWGLVRIFPGISLSLMLVSALVAGVFFILASAVLDYFVRKVEISNRKLFPDFMDLLIVCVDAGLSIEAAIDRVAREFLATKPVFGTHLAIIGLEVRAGRPLHEALLNFSDRVRLEEARTLATLFRQSQELGASVVKTLRSFSHEMRQVRLIKAEEKANSLPIKMLFPLAAFLFPVNLIIVVVPIMIVVMRMFMSLAPPAGF